MLHTLASILVTSIVVTNPSPPPPPPNSPSPPRPPPPNPSPPPTPPSDTFTSNDAFLGCRRADHQRTQYFYTYGSEDIFQNEFNVFNDTGLHNLEIKVNQETCNGVASVTIIKGVNGQKISLFSSVNGQSWNLLTETTFDYLKPPPPPPPAPSPPPPSIDFPVVLRQLSELPIITQGFSSEVHHARLNNLTVGQQPSYVRVCLNCDGTCNGIDHIDAIVSCFNGLSPPSAPPDATAIPWWVWLIVAIASLLFVIVIYMCVKNMQDYNASTKTPTPAQRAPARAPVTRKGTRTGNV